MKKSNKYLLFLIGAIFLAAILFPVLLQFLPTEEENSSAFDELMISDTEVAEVVESNYQTYEIPMVDADMSHIHLDNIYCEGGIAVIGVETPKDQRILVAGYDLEEYQNLIDINEATEGKVKISCPKEPIHFLDSVYIYVQKLSLVEFVTDCDASHSNDISITGVSTASLLLDIHSASISVDDCDIKNLSIINRRPSNFCDYILKNSSVGNLSIEDRNRISIAAGDCVGHLSIAASYDLNASVTGYDGKIDTVKNGFHIYLEQE